MNSLIFLNTCDLFQNFFKFYKLRSRKKKWEKKKFKYKKIPLHINKEKFSGYLEHYFCFQFLNNFSALLLRKINVLDIFDTVDFFEIQWEFWIPDGIKF